MTQHQGIHHVTEGIADVTSGIVARTIALGARVVDAVSNGDADTAKVDDGGRAFYGGAQFDGLDPRATRQKHAPQFTNLGADAPIQPETTVQDILYSILPQGIEARARSLSGRASDVGKKILHGLQNNSERTSSGTH